MNARIEKKDEIKRTITIGGTEYAMPKVAPDVYMDYLEARESIFTSEEKHKMYTKAQFVQMMETICALYGNQFTVEQLKDAETGLDHWAAFLETVKKYWNILKGASGADTAQPPAETPTTPAAFNVGDVVNFNGNVHYTSANAANGKACKSGKAKITQIYQLGKAKHPYHLVRESGGSATVWGWVDEKDVSEITAAAPAAKYSPAVGDAVKINSGVTAYSNGVKMPAWVRSATLYIRQIEKNGTILLVSTEKTKKVYTGRVKASDVHKA